MPIKKVHVDRYVVPAHTREVHVKAKPKAKPHKKTTHKKR